MFAKVHPAEDVKSGNTGSCHDLVRYLEVSSINSIYPLVSDSRTL